MATTNYGVYKIDPSIIPFSLRLWFLFLMFSSKMRSFTQRFICASSPEVTYQLSVLMLPYVISFAGILRDKCSVWAKTEIKHWNRGCTRITAAHVPAVSGMELEMEPCPKKAASRRLRWWSTGSFRAGAASLNSTGCTSIRALIDYTFSLFDVEE